ncbi:MAG: hypothetical protein JO352_06750 [Chloroflexi bacterium]|nr:hypothetical protein [Chloroflexota bacterium]
MRGPQDANVYYAKGPVVLYTLRDYLGADTLDAALARFMQRFRSGPPYPLASDLIDELRAATPLDRQYLLTDLLDTITFWQNSTESAVARQRPDGRYDVTLTMQVGKVRADSAGHMTDVAMDNDLIDIGVLGNDGRFLYLQKHAMHSGTNVVTVTVDGAPAQAGIDPMYKLINGAVYQNVVTVTPAD